MALQADWKEFLSLLNSHRVRYVVVGAHALAAHGQPRFTGDLDVLVEPTATNARRVLEALRQFGFGSLKISQSDLDRPEMVIRLGQAPVGSQWRRLDGDFPRFRPSEVPSNGEGLP